MTTLLDHPTISARYFFPRPDAPPEPWTVGIDGGQIDLACARIDRGRAAAVLHFHGNGEVVADWIDGFARALDGNGVDTFLAEYRGYGGSGGRPSLTTLLEDALAVFDAVTATGREAAEIVVYGRSIGSLAAAHVAAHRPIRALVLESGINDLYERLAVRVRASELGTTDDQLRAAVAAAFDQSAKIARSSCPILIVHCEHDDMVRKHHAERNAAAAGSRGRLVLFSRGDHNTIHAFNGEAIVGAVTALVGRPQDQGAKR